MNGVNGLDYKQLRMMKIERDWTFEKLLFYSLHKQILLEKEDERLDNES